MLIGKLDLEKIGYRLSRLDRLILELYGVRLRTGGLSGCVAEIKRRLSKNHGGIFEKRRHDVEDLRLERIAGWARQIGINPHFAQTVLYTAMLESCSTQDGFMVQKHHTGETTIDENDPEAVYRFQREDLLRLTGMIAPYYDDQYGKGYFGSETYLEFERGILGELIDGISDRRKAIDLGCATGIVTCLLAERFDLSVGYDICPAMIDRAKRKVTDRLKDRIDFIEHDIETGLEVEDGSVSLAVMNLGTASEVFRLEELLEELGHCLVRDGRFLLSFYNSESLIANIGFVPWPMPLAAHVDPERHCLEVHHENRLFFPYARPRSVGEVRTLLEASGLTVERTYTAPTLGSLLPRALLEHENGDGVVRKNTDVCDMIRNIDRELAGSGTNSGAYIIVTGRK